MVLFRANCREDLQLTGIDRSEVSEPESVDEQDGTEEHDWVVGEDSGKATDDVLAPFGWAGRFFFLGGSGGRGGDGGGTVGGKDCKESGAGSRGAKGDGGGEDVGWHW
ncbi:hypothetical protein OS493_007602 [Desmophyllum pertusum]|uniref:Uncharacterized protein n=1 Tax=Desmophyllum pertusum TaxID=174260 RepID=A0A9W9YSX1_9CNID|nr:hypothetical protein OS493_007602 [Desmophyllum pertusum]